MVFSKEVEFFSSKKFNLLTKNHLQEKVAGGIKQVFGVILPLFARLG